MNCFSLTLEVHYNCILPYKYEERLEICIQMKFFEGNYLLYIFSENFIDFKNPLQIMKLLYKMDIARIGNSSPVHLCFRLFDLSTRIK